MLDAMAGRKATYVVRGALGELASEATLPNPNIAHDRNHDGPAGSRAF
jgi:hypothetical protein